eukprot:m51a1_g9981 hypothetical protein (772) ;mRNA; f:16155-19358
MSEYAKGWQSEAQDSDFAFLGLDRPFNAYASLERPHARPPRRALAATELDVSDEPPSSLPAAPSLQRPAAASAAPAAAREAPLTGECPVCGGRYSASSLEAHVSACIEEAIARNTGGGGQERPCPPPSDGVPRAHLVDLPPSARPVARTPARVSPPPRPSYSPVRPAAAAAAAAAAPRRPSPPPPSYSAAAALRPPSPAAQEPGHGARSSPIAVVMRRLQPSRHKRSAYAPLSRSAHQERSFLMPPDSPPSVSDSEVDQMDLLDSASGPCVAGALVALHKSSSHAWEAAGFASPTYWELKGSGDVDRQWDSVVLPETEREAAARLRVLIRRGVPQHLRGRVWPLVTGASEFQQKRPNCYEYQSENTFGKDGAPRSMANYPTFGGSLDIGRHNLTPQGYEAAKRILCVIATMYPNLAYCPRLPDLVVILLHYLPEKDAFTVALRIVDKSATGERFLEVSATESAKLHRAFDVLVKDYYPAIHHAFERLGLSLTDMASQWFTHFFAGVLPYPIVLRIADCFLSEGSMIMCRIGLGLIAQTKDFITQPTLRPNMVQDLIEHLGQRQVAVNLFKQSFRLSLKSDKVERLKRGIRVPVSLQSPSRVYYRPKMETPSEIFSYDELETIWSFLPQRFCIMDPVLLFTSSRDGFNIKRLLDKADDTWPTILVVRAPGNFTFGCFASCSWKTSSRTFFGDGECFVFGLRPKVCLYESVIGESMFQRVSPDRDSISMGSEAISLFEDLKVTCAASSVFGCPALAPLSSPTECITVELWALE